MLILEAYRDLRMLLYPLREKDHTVHLIFIWHEIKRYIRTGRLCPGHLENTIGKLHDISLLVPHPTPGNHPAMYTVIYSVVIFSIPLVFPAIIVGVNKVCS